MSRPLRIEFPNAWYHVMNRGAARQPIMKSPKHAHTFVNLLEKISEDYGIEIHAYCLMGNHYHLLVRTPYANLSEAMRHLNSMYTRRFNRAEKRDGPLFRGRFKSIIVDAEDYLVALSRYIHRNPVEAKLVKNPLGYPWSSFAAYLDRRLRPSWLHTYEVVRLCSPRNQIEDYKKLVENPLLPSFKQFFRSAYVPSILGDKKFRQAILSKHDPISHEIPYQIKLRGSPALHRIIHVCADAFNVPTAAITAKKRGFPHEERNIAMLIAKQDFGYKLQAIGNAFGQIKYNTVSASICLAHKALIKNPLLAEKAEVIKARLSNH